MAKHKFESMTLAPVLVDIGPEGELIVIEDPTEEPRTAIGCAICDKPVHQALAEPECEGIADEIPEWVTG